MLILAVTACNGTAQPGVDASPTTMAAPLSTTTASRTAAEASTPTTVPNPADPVALITRAGVPVAVTRVLDPGYWVLTPCGRDQFVTGGVPLQGATVVLDPGHGGRVDTGAVGDNGLAEKTVNLRVARLAAGLLEEEGIDVVLTRTDDYASPLYVRANLADALGAELMVSIHHNAPTPGRSDEPGTEVFIQDGSGASSRLGGLLWETTRDALGLFDIEWAAAEDAGVMTVINSRGADAYGILRHPETPTALVELGYMSNPPEARLFATALYARVAGRAVAEAVSEYMSSETNSGSGFVEGREFNPRPGIGQDVCEDPDLG